MGKHLKDDEYNFAPKILGVDVAMFGGDRSVIVLRQGLMSKILFQTRGIEPERLASIAINLQDEHKADAVIVDAIGVGQAVISAMHLMNRQPIAFNAAGKATLDNCMNSRADMKRRTLSKRGDQVVVVVSAMGKETDELLHLASQVRFLGIVTHADLPDLLAASDAVVLPSYWEGLPVALIEALAAGKPIVATRVGGNPELVVDGENGWLVAPGDVPALAAALTDLAQRPRHELHALGEASRRRFQAGGFEPAAVAARTVAAYHLAQQASRSRINA